MSLIYSALTTLDQDGNAVAPAVPGAAHRPAWPWRPIALGAGLAMLVAGGAAVLLARKPLPAAPAVAVAAPLAPVAPVPAVVLAPRAEPQAVIPAAAVLAPAVAAPVVAPAPADSAAVPATVLATVARKRAPESAVNDSGIEFHARRGASAAGAAVPKNAVSKDAANQVRTEQLAREATQAIDAGRKDEADALLAQLSALLPPESITLLKLRAWRALRGGDALLAESLYRQIVARLPDDEPAAINLAILNWQAGRKDDARRMVAESAERHPDSELTQKIQLQFGSR